MSIAPPMDRHLCFLRLSIRHQMPAEGDKPHHGTGRIADGNNADAVGAAKEIHETGLGKFRCTAPGARAGCHGFGSVTTANGFQFFGDFVQGLIPRYLLPLVGPAGPGALHGKAEPKGMVLVVLCQGRTHTECTRDNRSCGVNGHPLHLPISDIDFHGAAHARTKKAGRIL